MLEERVMPKPTPVSPKMAAKPPPITPRHQARMCVLQLLCQIDLQGITEREAAERESVRFWEMSEASRPAKTYGRMLALHVIREGKQIDAILIASLTRWKIERLGTVVRAALRIGVGEILQGEVAPAVIINEAVLLTKAFMDDASARFVNSVLDACQQRAR